MLEIDRLSARARGSRVMREVLHAVSLTARPGEVLAILGPNGAGKTTLLEAMSGVVAASGTIAWKGVPLVSFRDRARVFALMPDEAQLPEEMAVRSVLGGARLEKLPATLGLAPLFDRGAGDLSRGEAKRVWLAMTLAEDRPVMLLDEPFGAFDPLQLDDVLDVVRARARAGATVIVTIHQLSTAERIADRIVLLAEGRAIAEGTLAELRGEAKLADGASLEEIFRKLVSDVAA